ncbi:MAG TPA: tetratricopeptide repeat protein [Tepidisphaeraceae bacterium]|nr:tetratricopeptide repeat protein [Tepidisphaeraceae bacterium]
MSTKSYTQPRASTNDDLCAGLFTTDAVAGLLHVSPQRVRAWRTSGLIEPTLIRYGVEYYDFAQLSAARSLCDLVRSGLKPARLKQVLATLRARVADGLPLPSLVAQDGRVMVRTDDAELAEADGQLQITFDEDEPVEPVKLHDAEERSASEWFDRGATLEAEDDVAGAAEAYRRALQQGGPDAEICFALAFVLAQVGDAAAAIERYREAVEINPDYGDAWNNLGALLSDTGDRGGACNAFRQALRVNPGDTRAHYNLADTLDELGRNWEATPHWQRYLRHDGHSEWATYARSRVG